MGCGASIQRHLAPEAPRLMYHGTSKVAGESIRDKGFTASAEGELGPGVYLVDSGNIEKAKRFAHDTFCRIPEFRRSSSSNEPVLITCTLRAKCSIKLKGADKTGSWRQKGYDACYTDQTGLSKSSEWCVADPSLIEILRIEDLRGTGCPWGGWCPYTTKNSKAPGSPWGGRCPMEPQAATALIAPAACATAGCGKPSWNGQSGEYCSITCKRTSLSLSSAAQADGPATKVNALTTVITDTSGICDLPNCGKPTWNGKKGFCSKTCRNKMKPGASLASLKAASDYDDDISIQSSSSSNSHSDAAIPLQASAAPLVRFASGSSPKASSDPGDICRLQREQSESLAAFSECADDLPRTRSDNTEATEGSVTAYQPSWMLRKQKSF